jgi:hypothetical protein
LYISPNSASTESESIQPGMCQQYSDNYLSFTFFWCDDAVFPIPECLVCGEKLSNNAVVPSKLKRHFTTKHPSLACKDITYFCCLMQQNKKQAKFMTSPVRTSEEVQEASYKVAELIIKAKGHIQ